MSDPIILTIFVCGVLAALATGALAVWIFMYGASERRQHDTPKAHGAEDDPPHGHHPKWPPRG